MGHGSVHRVNAAQGGPGQSELKVSAASMMCDRVELPSLSKEQSTTLLKLLDTRNKAERLYGKNIDDLWLIDTGASHHMTGKSELLTNMHDPGRYVYLTVQ